MSGRPVVKGPVVLSLSRLSRILCGRGIRRHEPLLEFFEKVVNLVWQHAPRAAIAFNSGPEDTADAALRWLRQATKTQRPAARAAWRRGLGSHASTP
jgi:hypothetical protein